ncbi:hypothetical protein T01_14616 [Trichinella spiralis]|uniref:Uncharacterized protein n=1 Tax=Trichinella spiralis TaxID=6334 RepID=A0A0V1AM06_TRISP|nr:hypothetical protein T01_14616 [Trichinella spiralis]
MPFTADAYSISGVVADFHPRTQRALADGAYLLPTRLHVSI